MQPTPWCSASEIEARVEAAGVTGVDLDLMCQVATDLLFELSGRRFNAVTETIRPARADTGCECFRSAGEVVPSSSGRFCSCSPTRIELPEPVIDIDEVSVEGVALVEHDDYELYDARLLVRMTPTNAVLQGWPCCQDLSRPLGELGTFSITLSHGQTVNDAGAMAARELAYELALGAGGSTQCGLPSRVMQITRQGITMTVRDKTYLADHKLGIAVVDMFLEAYNPDRLRRRPSVASPDTVSSYRTS